MLLLLRLAPALLRSLFLSHSVLLLENVVLRHQLSVLQRSATRPRLRQADAPVVMTEPRGVPQASG